MTYKEKKEQVRTFAQEWQAEMSERNYSYAELAVFCDMFVNLGKRYGLLKEFKENGIID